MIKQQYQHQGSYELDFALDCADCPENDDILYNFWNLLCCLFFFKAMSISMSIISTCTFQLDMQACISVVQMRMTAVACDKLLNYIRLCRLSFVHGVCHMLFMSSAVLAYTA